MSLKYYPQETEYSCGPAAMRIALSGLKIEKSEEELIKLLNTSAKHGTYFQDFILLTKKLKLSYISEANSSISNLTNLIKNKYIIIICYYSKKEQCDHFSVVKKMDKENIYFSDPWFGQNHKYSLSYFQTIWRNIGRPNPAKKWFLAIKK